MNANKIVPTSVYKYILIAHIIKTTTSSPCPSAPWHATATQRQSSSSNSKDSTFYTAALSNRNNVVVQSATRSPVKRLSKRNRQSPAFRTRPLRRWWRNYWQRRTWGSRTSQTWRNRKWCWCRLRAARHVCAACVDCAWSARSRASCAGRSQPWNRWWAWWW